MRRLDETKVIGSLYLLKPLLEKLSIREAVDGVVLMQRDVGGLTHGQVLEQLIINRLDAPCPLVDIEYWAHEATPKLSTFQLHSTCPIMLNID
jgi:hypothetical protein